MSGTFRGAIARIPTLADKVAPGLRALRNRDRGAIEIDDPRKLVGSVDLDSALVTIFPGDSRWDYCIGIRKSAKSDRVVWIEVHPANSISVKDLVRKANWLFSWLRGAGKPLASLDTGAPELRWIPTGPVAFRRGSRQHTLLAQAGVGFPERRVNLSRRGP